MDKDLHKIGLRKINDGGDYLISDMYGVVIGETETDSSANGDQSHGEQVVFGEGFPEEPACED